MICEYCGSNIPDGAKFCPLCGEVLKTKERVPIKSSSIDSSSEPDFKIPLEKDVEIPVVPTKFNYSEIPLEKPPIRPPSRRPPRKLYPSEAGIIALVIIGIIGGLFLLAGILLLTGVFGPGSNNAMGNTLITIGVIICIVILGIASRGGCCSDCCC